MSYWYEAGRKAGQEEDRMRAERNINSSNRRRSGTLSKSCTLYGAVEEGGSTCQKPVPHIISTEFLLLFADQTTRMSVTYIH
jgi:hypothetical protein